MSVQNICLLDATIYQLADDQYRLFGHERNVINFNGQDDGELLSIFSLRLRRTEVCIRIGRILFCHGLNKE